MLELFEAINYLLGIIAFVCSLYIVRKTRQMSLSVPFVYFSSGTLLLILSLLFFKFNELGIYHLSEITLQIWEHFIIYLSLISFILGGIRFKQVCADASNKLALIDKLVLILLILSGIAIFIVANHYEIYLFPLFHDSVIERFGLHHFTVFLLAVISAFYINYVKKDWSAVLSVSSRNFLAFLVLIGIIHFWELVTESLKWISFSEANIELIEGLIMAFALIFLILMMKEALSGLKKVFKI